MKWVIVFGHLMGNPVFAKPIETERVYTSFVECEARARAVDRAARFDGWYHFCRRVEQ